MAGKDISEQGGSIFPDIRTGVILHALESAQRVRFSIRTVEEQTILHFLTIEISGVDEKVEGALLHWPLTTKLITSDVPDSFSLMLWNVQKLVDIIGLDSEMKHQSDSVLLALFIAILVVDLPKRD